jgi:tetratricopeptide (TPR) repeat protein
MKPDAPESPRLRQTLLATRGILEIEDGNYLLARQLLGESIDALEKADAAKTPDYCELLIHLAAAELEDGDAESASDHAVDAANLATRLFGDWHPLRERAFVVQAREAITRGKVQLALELKDKAAPVVPSPGFYGGQYWETLATIHLRRRAYQDAARCQEAAVEEYKNCSAKLRHSFALCDLGAAYWYLRDEQKLETAYDEGLPASYELVDPTHPKLLQILRIAAGQTIESRGFEDAKAILERVAQWHRSRENQLAFEYSEVLRLLGCCNARLNEFQAADRALQEAISLARTGGPGQRESLASILHSLALLRIEQQEFDSARNAIEESSKIRLELFGEKSLSHAKSLYLAAHLDYVRGELANARRQLEMAIKIVEETYGNEAEDLIPFLYEVEQVTETAEDRKAFEEYRDRRTRLEAAARAKVAAADIGGLQD